MTAAAWDVPGCAIQVRRLAAVADDLDRVSRRLDRLAAALDWTGAAATEARARLARAGVAVSTLTGLVRRSADGLWLGLAGLGEAARLSRLPAQDPTSLAEAAAVARTADAATAGRLAAVVAGRPDGGRPLLPPAGAPPRDVARWWTALPPLARERAIVRHADVLGRLAGLPATVRDVANRRVLTRLLATLRGQLDGRPRTDPDAVRAAAAVSVRLRLAESVERRLGELERSGTTATLLTLDLDGAGRVAIGVGDLDTARHVAVVVPGMGQDAGHGLARTVEQAVRLREHAGGSTATVAWTGYAAPGLAQVPFATRARVGGRLLAADLLALSAARQVAGGSPPHLTVVAHSYGTTVVGAAALAGPLPADDLVLLGSPGTLADRVTDLSVRPQHVYVGEARFDPVADLGAFGADPGDASFGAIRIGAEPGPDVPWRERLSGGDHSHYYDPDSESLANAARVVAGHGAETTRPAG